MSSIRRHLTLLLIASLTLVSFSAALQGYRSSMQMSSKLFDAELTSLTSSFADIQVRPNSQIFDSAEQITVQIWQDNQLLLRSRNSPISAIGDFKTGFSEQNFAGKRWRIYSTENPAQKRWTMVAQPLKSRSELAQSMILAAMMPLIFSIPVLAIIIYFVVSQGLKPLRTLSTELNSRSPRNFQAFNLADKPAELVPVLSTLNSLLSRLQSAFEREQQFAANAAHELRTPLSVLKINLHNLAKETAGNSHSIDKLQQDTDRMIHVINQILLLSRTNPEYFEAHSHDIDLYQIAQQAISDRYTAIDNKRQSIELVGQSAVISSDEFALLTLLQNLLTNANKYTPELGAIRVSVTSDTQYVRIAVEDSGAGLNEDEYQKVLQRFYRSSKHIKQKSQGSGLGLAIVKQIVELHDGTIDLHKSDLGGLCVLVELPLAPSPGRLA
jgi:two-component system sensor histidine kinase QseC